ncbi:hypothetical protein [Aureimonas leprariae]|uniref:General stress protein 17M-like domain-containing protein n=1 Tax=Plantimonas leprariae TaxID=2615207 RepID=A0A7V7PLD8_9HYPH|nr:hypothetical protein [Aureimonas leprariae]KAB0677167.1 hypothetical protein F6X38_18745 [Aureimonas leprariae]
MSSLQPSSKQSVTAFFDSRSDADAAATRIRAEGVSDADIRIVAGESDLGTSETRGEKKGFWESLSDFFLPNEDRYAYAEGLSRGGYFVSVATSAANHDRILDILDDEGTVDMDAREASWRAEGWEGYQAGRDDDIGSQAFGRPASATGGLATDAAASAATAGAMPIGGTTGLRTGTASNPADATGLNATEPAGAYDRQDPLVTEDGVMPARDERFGRRDMSSGRARVRSYFSDDDRLDDGLSAVDQAQPVSDQVRRTDVELEDERRDRADDLTRRTGGTL